MRSLLLTTMCLTGSLALVACSNHRADTTDHNKQPTIEVPVASAAFTAFGNKEKSWRTVIEGNKLSVEADFLNPTTVMVVGSGSTDTQVLVYFRGPMGVSKGGLVLDATYDTAPEKAAVYAALEAKGIQCLDTI